MIIYYFFPFQRNPAIKLYGLPWAFPGWVGEYTESPYTNPQKTANYILKWIQGAKKHYNLTIDYIGVSGAIIVVQVTLRGPRVPGRPDVIALWALLSG